MIEFELLRLFRPAPGHHHGPIGAYLTEPTNIWLDIGDKIQIIKQGGIAHKPLHPNETYAPEVFSARVLAISSYLCFIAPTHKPLTVSQPPKPIDPSATKTTTDAVVGNSVQTNAQKSENKLLPQNKSLPIADTEGTIDDATDSLKGEWVPRNTLRFQSFLRRGPKLTQLTLLPTNTRKQC
jgi:hypothetical protein